MELFLSMPRTAAAVTRITTPSWRKLRTKHALALLMKSWLRVDATHEKILFDLSKSAALSVTSAEELRKYSAHAHYLSVLRAGARVAQRIGSGDVRMTVAAKAMGRQVTRLPAVLSRCPLLSSAASPASSSVSQTTSASYPTLSTPRLHATCIG